MIAEFGPRACLETSLPDGYQRASALLIVDGYRQKGPAGFCDSRKIWVGRRANAPGTGTWAPPMGRGEQLDIDELLCLYDGNSALCEKIRSMTLSDREVAAIEGRQEAGFDFLDSLDKISYVGQVLDSAHGYVLHAFEKLYEGEPRLEPLRRDGIYELTGQDWRPLGGLLREPNMTKGVKAIFEAYDISTRLLGRPFFRARV